MKTCPLTSAVLDDAIRAIGHRNAALLLRKAINATSLANAIRSLLSYVRVLASITRTKIDDAILEAIINFLDNYPPPRDANRTPCPRRHRPKR